MYKRNWDKSRTEIELSHSVDCETDSRTDTKIVTCNEVKWRYERKKNLIKIVQKQMWLKKILLNKFSKIKL